MRLPILILAALLVALPAWAQIPTPGPSVVAYPVPLTAIPRGGTIAFAAVPQTLMAENARRKAFSIQNPCTAAEQGIAVAESLVINLTNAAALTGNGNLAVIPPCAEYALGLAPGVMSTELISVIAVSAGHIWYAKEYQQ